jgi:hypothetical protein
MGGSSMSVSGFQFTKRTYLIIILIGIAVVAGVAIYLSQQPSPASAKSKLSETVTITILDSIGIDRITITNRDTGKSIVKTIVDLPYSFNCTRGDTIKLQATMQQEFQWDAWEFVQSGTFDHKNPASFKADGVICMNNKITVNPCYIDLEISPTNSPTPSPSPTPIE